jgi:hypothetical protein
MKKKQPKLPKLRFPVPPGSKKHDDRKKEEERRLCRKKVAPADEESK